MNEFPPCQHCGEVRCECFRDEAPPTNKVLEKQIRELYECMMWWTDQINSHEYDIEEQKEANDDPDAIEFSERQRDFAKNYLDGKIKELTALGYTVLNPPDWVFSD